MRILLTGAAGFIGFHTAMRLLERGDTVIGFDNLNAYYDPTLKDHRLSILKTKKGFSFVRGDLKNMEDLESAFTKLGEGPETRVVHLAAQAGVRHSIEKPDIFLSDNVHGTNNVFECAKSHKVGGVIYASTSAVYGDNRESPFREDYKTDMPISLYGMTKKANELQAYCYWKLHGVKSTGLRFFTVYGPYGRPDMALFLFTAWALRGEPMKIFGQGKMQRDFTFVEDIVSGVVAAVDKNYDYEIFNLGGGKTEELMDYVQALERALGITAHKEFLPMQPGDVVATSADISKARRMLGYDPKTHIDVGVPKFVEWYRKYYNV